MAGFKRTIPQNEGPVDGDLATPVSTKPATTKGVFNSTVGIAAEKILSKSTDPRQAVRRVKLYNPSATQTLGWTTRIGAAPTLTSSVAGTGATDGSTVAAQSTEWFTIPDNCDLYLAASAAATVYQLTVVEI